MAKMEMITVASFVDTRSKVWIDWKITLTSISLVKWNVNTKKLPRKTTEPNPMHHRWPKKWKSKKKITKRLRQHRHRRHRKFLNYKCHNSYKFRNIPDRDPRRITLSAAVEAVLQVQRKMRINRQQWRHLPVNSNVILVTLDFRIWVILWRTKNIIVVACKPLCETYQRLPKKEAMGVNRPPNKVRRDSDRFLFFCTPKLPGLCKLKFEK